LPSDENLGRERRDAHLATALLHLQENDGSWWDFPLNYCHQQYGRICADGSV